MQRSIYIYIYIYISNAAIVASKYMTDPKKTKKKEHWTEVNWILRYLTDTRALVPFLIRYELVQNIELWGWWLCWGSCLQYLAGKGVWL